MEGHSADSAGAAGRRHRVCVVLGRGGDMSLLRRERVGGCHCDTDICLIVSHGYVVTADRDIVKTLRH